MPVRQGSKGWPAGWCDEIPAVFTSLDEARNSMDYLWSSTTTWFQQLEAAMSTVEERRVSKNGLCKRYHAWSIALDAFLALKGPELIGSIAKKGITCLRILQRVAEMLLEKFMMENPIAETTWDFFLDDHKEILRLTESVIEPPPCVTDSPMIQPDFSLDMTLVAPLWVVAAKCRDPQTRRRAISLLYSVPRIEGIWSSVVAAQVAQRIMELEENGLEQITKPSDVPGEARIAVLSVTFDPDKRSMVLCLAYSNSMDHRMQEVFEW